MKNAIFVHGRPSKLEARLVKSLGFKYSTFLWSGWLGKQLEKNGYEYASPEMPRAYDPIWDVWVKKVERFEIGPQTMLIGHSTGAGFWIRYLSERPNLEVGKVILVAPWLGYDYGAPPTNFFEGYKIDPNIAKRTKGLVIFHSDDDFEAIQKSIAKLKNTLKGADYKEFHNYGHFTLGSMKTRKFPELLEECLKPSLD